MTTIVTRAGKGSPLTNAEVDANFTNLNDAKIETLTSLDASVTITGTGLSRDLSVVVSGAGNVVGPASATDNAIARFDATTGKLIQNSIVTIDDNGNANNVNAITFDTTPTNLPTTSGSLFWDDGNKTPSVILNSNTSLQLGQENVALVYNGTGSTIAKGAVVAVSGAQGQRPSVVLADADSEALSAATLGIAAEAILNGAEGFICTFGLVRGINTSAFVAGDDIYLSQTAGGITATRPTAPAHTVFLGWVISVNASSGELFVNINNGWELNELHNVLITSPASGNTLIYDATAGVWKNANITGSTGLSVTNGAGTIALANTGVTSAVAGTGISVSGATGAVTVTNTAPDQVVTLTGGGATSITGTYPNFTISSANTTYSLATSTVLGLIELGSDTVQTTAASAVTSTASRSYALQVNAAGQGVINVPWTDTNSGGTVTSVGGTGTVNGITLTGSVTSSGNLTLGGTLSNVSLSTQVTGTLPIANGGTGQTTKAAAYNALSPITTTGDLIIGNGSNSATRLAIGTNGQVLTSNGTTATWSTSAGGSAATPTVLGTVFGRTQNASPSTTTLGHNAGNATTGVNCTFVGRSSGLSNTSGYENTALGFESLRDNTTSFYNTAVGSEALRLNTGESNTAVGAQCLSNGSTGSANTAVGNAALRFNTAGSNTAVGISALGANTSGANNTALGTNAGDNLTTGANNIVIGRNAAASSATVSNENTWGNSSSTSNRFWGDMKMAGANAGTSGQVLTSAGAGVAPTWSAVSVAAATPTVLGTVFGDTDSATPFLTTLGRSAGNVTTGVNNTFVGYEAGLLNTSGSGNTAVGSAALDANTTGISNTAIGDNALGANTTGNSNVAIGRLAFLANTTGFNGVAIGANALDANTTGNRNTAVGYNALTANTTGGSNTAIGGEALAANTTAVNNVAVGFESLRRNTTGEQSVAVGTNTLDANTTGGYHVAIGHQALFSNTTGNFNIAIGMGALYANGVGANNVAVGYDAFASVTGSNNTALGYQAGKSGTNNLTTGANNILIGYNATASSATVSNETTIGNSSTTMTRIFGKLELQNGAYAGISSTVASASTITPTSDTTNQYTVTALAVAATIAIPTGTPDDGQKLTIRIKDNGTARALTWTTSAGGYRIVGTTLPTTTVVSKVLYVGCIYNSQDAFWDVIAVAQQA